MVLPGTVPTGGVSLRLLWPQWQGAGISSVAELAAEFPLDVAQRGYAVGSAVLQAVLPAHDGPTVTVPVTMSDEGLAERDGVEAKAVVRDQLAAALEVIGQHDPARIATLGGECSVSVAPFSYLAHRYGEDLAIIWIDSHPDIGTSDSEYPAGTRWPSPHLPATAIPACWNCSRRLSRPARSPWPGCTPGPRTTSPTWPAGVSSRSAPASSAAPQGDCWTGSRPPAARALSFTST